MRWAGHVALVGEEYIQDLGVKTRSKEIITKIWA
jgi:hypothetical protein